MKVKDMIRALESLSNQDAEVRISVRDHFSQYGEPATADWSPKRYGWSFTNGNHCSLTIYLDAKEVDGKEKVPKITYRKPTY